MKHVSIIWKDIDFPRGLGVLVNGMRDITMYTIGYYPGFLIYKGEARELEYYSATIHPDMNVIKRVTGIVSLWINKLPAEVKLP